MKRGLYFIILIFLISACSNTNQELQKKRFGDSIQIDNFKFIPSTIYITKGTTVTWTNNEGVSHQILLKNINIESNVLQIKDTFNFKFDNIGEYDYICKIHPSMNGKIIVE